MTELANRLGQPSPTGSSPSNLAYQLFALFPSEISNPQSQIPSTSPNTTHASRHRPPPKASCHAISASSTLYHLLAPNYARHATPHTRRAMLIPCHCLLLPENISDNIFKRNGILAFLAFLYI